MFVLSHSFGVSNKLSDELAPPSPRSNLLTFLICLYCRHYNLYKIYPRNFFHSPNMPPKSDKSAQAALIRQKAHYRATNRLHLVYPPPPRLLLSPIHKHGHSPARSIFPGGVIAKNITRTRLSPRRPTVPRCTCTRFLGATPTTRSLFHKASLHLAT